MIAKLTGAVSTLALAVLFNGSVIAQSFETSFTYNGLYKSIKTASANEFSQVALNFYLFKKQPQEQAITVCPVESGYISDGEHTMDLIVTGRGQMLLPLDKKLKQDHAAITIITPQENMCQLKMQIEVASFELANSSVQSVNGWASQITALYQKLAGWPGRYLMPDLIGLNFQLRKLGPATVYVVAQGERELVASSQNSQLYLSLNDLAKLPSKGQFEFSSELISATPRLSQ